MDIIWHRKMHHAGNEKRQTTPDGWKVTTKSRQNWNVRRKENLLIIGDLERWHLQTGGDERKKLRKSILGESKGYSRQNYIAETLSKEDIPRLFSS